MVFLLGGGKLGLNWKSWGWLGLLLILGLSGCKSKFVAGHYSGSLTHFLPLGSVSESIQSVIPIEIDIVPEHRQSGLILIQDESKNLIHRFKFRHPKKGVYEIGLSFPDLRWIALKKKGNCYLSSGAQGDSTRVDVCFNEREFSLSVRDSDHHQYFRLSADPFQVPESYEMEAPRKFTLSEALDLALEKNLETRAEYEKMTQATLRAKAAWLSLLPRLNTRAGTTLLAMFVPVNIAVAAISSSLGDWMPVLLPSRWFRAHSSTSLGDAERMAFQAMRANLATHVESLAYVLDQQDKMVTLYDRWISQLGPMRYEGLERVLVRLKLEQAQAQSVYHATRRALSQALGLHNPEAVAGFVLADEPTLLSSGDRTHSSLESITSAVSLQQDEVLKLARERSFELEQVFHLIQSAKYDQKSHWWWSLDPTLDPNYSLGPALPTLIAVDQSRIQELHLMADRVSQDLAQRVYETVRAFNEGLRLFPLAERLYGDSEKELTELLNLILTGGPVNPDTLISKIQLLMGNLIRCEAILIDFRLSRAKIDRLLLRGSYERLLPRVL